MEDVLCKAVELGMQLVKSGTIAQPDFQLINGQYHCPWIGCPVVSDNAIATHWHYFTSHLQRSIVRCPETDCLVGLPTRVELEQHWDQALNGEYVEFECMVPECYFRDRKRQGVVQHLRGFHKMAIPKGKPNMDYFNRCIMVCREWFEERGLGAPAVSIFGRKGGEKGPRRAPAGYSEATTQVVEKQLPQVPGSQLSPAPGNKKARSATKKNRLKEEANNPYAGLRINEGLPWPPTGVPLFEPLPPPSPFLLLRIRVPQAAIFGALMHTPLPISNVLHMVMYGDASAPSDTRGKLYTFSSDEAPLPPVNQKRPWKAPFTPSSWPAATKNKAGHPKLLGVGADTASTAITPTPNLPPATGPLSRLEYTKAQSLLVEWQLHFKDEDVWHHIRDLAPVHFPQSTEFQTIRRICEEKDLGKEVGEKQAGEYMRMALGDWVKRYPKVACGALEWLVNTLDPERRFRQ